MAIPVSPLQRDSDTSGSGTAAGGFWQEPLERLPGYLITFQARNGVVFDAAARQTLALVAHASARLRDGETGDHLERVHRITRLIAA
jgi:hypothetical protein